MGLSWKHLRKLRHHLQNGLASSVEKSCYTKRHKMDYFRINDQKRLLHTEFFPTNNLNDRGAISIHQVVESLNMGESILSPEARLQRSQISRK